MIGCTAVVMAGGKSCRMGREKALIEIGGIPLWKLQQAKLAMFADEVLISAKEGIIDVPVVKDLIPGLGPLGGLASVLEVAGHERVLLLGVDMPGMTAVYLESLLAGATSACGVVPMMDGFYQGLAAVYPRSILPLARDVLAGEDHSMQLLNRLAIAKGQMRVCTVLQEEYPLFRNWNTAADMASEHGGF